METRDAQGRFFRILAGWALAAAAVFGCDGGSESNFGNAQAPGGGGTGGQNSCATCADAGGSRTDAGPSFGGGGGGYNPGGGTCATGGHYTYPYPLGTGGQGTGGQGTGGQTPTCPVDADGVATVTQADICGMEFRCPATAADLLKGLDCVDPATDTGGVTLTTGCGRQTVRIEGVDFSYAAHFEPQGTGFLSVEVRRDVWWGPCSAYAYRTAPSPDACASDVTYGCTPQKSVPSLQGCRTPGSPECGTCCTQTDQGCTVWTTQTGSSSTSYDAQTSLPGLCPCNCSPCATCLPDSEQRLRILGDAPNCNCAPPGSSGQGGTGTACDSYCPTLNNLVTSCPEIR